MDEDQGSVLVRQFFPGTAGSYDRIVNLCTLGFDRAWKNRMLEKIPEGSTRIMDQACGTGILTLRIAEKFPDASIVGVDVTEEYLLVAKEKAARLKLSNLHFVLGAAEDVLLHQSFDCIISSYLAKYARIGSLIPIIRKMLRPDGVVIMHDFTYPANRAFSYLWRLYFRLLQSVGARKYPQWRAAFEGLPGLLRETRWTDELEKSLQKNDFSKIAVEYLTFGTSAIITARRI